MNRIEIVREYVDGVLLDMTDAQERRNGYMHLYGVAQNCALLALRRGNLGGFDEGEIDCICHAIYHHSDKMDVHQPMDELLKDADALQHGLYDPLCPVREIEMARWRDTIEELGVAFQTPADVI